MDCLIILRIEKVRFSLPHENIKYNPNACCSIDVSDFYPESHVLYGIYTKCGFPTSLLQRTLFYSCYMPNSEA
ncbi:hypothetical protein T03_14839 [Trichinella britovi]|uniref:Uncharacterized protein n=1 Tax=Trichinella britovi TaxID=45882 RepID=A0A0V1BV38_TRIBR|nr:hypothetical protein T03_8345 [Trichinella britovi]KRY40638.1 hypothetical protein T03_14839 [Trichinella britovi]